ncbi:Aste57867_6839 [Aphanomyces stellatus]|uniref:Aste57867_145 protein n=1 Tax=Aphanomyces stellatus TaxID=120398 RepID=A0A485KHX6_9STRA|nr:hypothetical protein As57867_006818 [Aphanomyces stellatus]KAF0720720.1 hypothetical protein As57867_000145 [Aphanomyces stellatus]VFT77371.1 Aste57867_145 [Aphanomyces stellatus]VFT83801.1 Aste57867_6839 [Aphanomyces stellatus]
MLTTTTIKAFFSNAKKPSSTYHKTTKPVKGLKLTNPFKQSAAAKCHPTPIVLRAPRASLCCEKRATAAATPKELSMVVYQVVDRSILRKYRSIVGGQQVPFHTIQNAFHRVVRHKGAVLDSIDEEADPAECDACRGHKLALVPACVSITLH